MTIIDNIYNAYLDFPYACSWHTITIIPVDSKKVIKKLMEYLYEIGYFLRTAEALINKIGVLKGATRKVFKWDYG